MQVRLAIDERWAVTASPLHYPLELDPHMRSTDAAFWYAEQATPELRPLVAGLLMLERPPPRDLLRASVERWIARLPRLRQRVVEAPFHLGLPRWEADEHFELEYHAREMVLPSPATERHLLDFAGAVFATPLDRMRPLWEAYLIEGLHRGKAACFFKVHHSVVDGVGSLAMFDAMTQARRDDPVHVPRCKPAHAPSAPGVSLLHAARATLDGAAAGVEAAAAIAARGVVHPGETVAGLWRAVRGVRGLLTDLTTPGTDDPLARESTGIGRRLDAMTLPLPRLLRIKDALGVTLNDVVLTALSGAVGRYHAHHKAPVAELHCMVPMSLRRNDEHHALGNRVGAFNVALPVGEPDVLQRLAVIRRQTGIAKHDRRAAFFPLLTQAIMLMPSFAYRLLAQSATRQVNLICTNMPGPPAHRYFAGVKVERIHPFAPVALGVPLSIALLSYGDTYGIGLDSDPAAIPDVELLHRYLVDAVDELGRAARLTATRRPPNGARRMPSRSGAARRPARAAR